MKIANYFMMFLSPGAITLNIHAWMSDANKVLAFFVGVATLIGIVIVARKNWIDSRLKKIQCEREKFELKMDKMDAELQKQQQS